MKQSAALKETIANLEKKYGSGVLTTASDAVVLTPRKIPFGAFIPDVVSGGGMPYGKVTRAFGPPQSAKSTLALKGLASAQGHCRECALPLQGPDIFGEECGCSKAKKSPMRGAVIDAEHRLDKLWMERQGVNLDETIVAQPTTQEQAIDTLNALMASGEIDFFMIDSIAALIPQDELGNDAEKSLPGLSARLTNKLIRIIQGNQNRGSLRTFRRPTVFLITQLREKIGVVFGNPETETGGRGQRYASSLDFECRSSMRRKQKGGKHTDDPEGDPTFAEVRLACTKNSTFPGMKRGTFKLFVQDDHAAGYRAGQTDDIHRMLAAAKFYSLAGMAKGQFQVGDRKLEGKPKSAKEVDVVAAVRADAEFVQHIRRTVLSHHISFTMGQLDE